MARTISLTDLPFNTRRGASVTTEEHAKALRIGEQSRGTFLLFASGGAVEVDALVSAIVDGITADVTRFGASTVRSHHANTLHALYKIVRSAQTADDYADEGEAYTAAATAYLGKRLVGTSRIAVRDFRAGWEAARR